MAPPQTFALLASTLSLLAITYTVRGNNITKILSKYSDYSSFNTYLSQTNLAEEINRYPTITLLALNNDAMSSFAAKRPLSVVRKVLSLLTLLDYYDPQNLQQISEGTTLSVTLYNNTVGNTPEYLGFVNITDLYGGKVAFGSAVSGSKLDSYFTKSVKQIPYSISVVEIDAPIIAPGILLAPSPPPSSSNVTALLEKAGCKTFSSSLTESGVLKTYESAVKNGGLTVFAPSDEAFKVKGVPDLTKLTRAEVVSLLEYHALPRYRPRAALKTNRNKLSTLAGKKFDLTTSTSGDEVVLHTGVASSRLVDTVLDATPVVIFTVDNVLLPTELFGKPPSPAPAPVPAEGVSPSEPPTDEPSGSSHSESPTGLANSKSANAAVAGSSPSLFTALVVTFATIAVSVSCCC